jgi:hypothetical protein
MLRNDLVIELREELGYIDDTKDAQIIRKLKRAQTNAELLPSLPWFLITEYACTNTVVDEERIEIPADFLREYEEGSLWIELNGKWKEVFKSDLQDLSTFNWTITQDRYYSLNGKYFRMFPTPDAIYPIRMLYYAAEPILDTNIENQWTKYVPDLLFYWAGIYMARAKHDKIILQEMTAGRNETLDLLNIHNEARKHDNRNYSFGKL